MIPIYKPYFPPNCLNFAHDAINSTWVSSQGKYISMVSEKLQELLGVKYVLPVNNGTSACHLVAKCVAEKKHIHEVIVPNNVYVAAWNAFLFDFNYDLHAIDANLTTWNVDLENLAIAIESRPQAAVLIVHNVGNIINVPALQRRFPNTTFIEDNCEGFLGQYEGAQTGTASFASSISFFGNKNITCGEGGAFLTNDEEAYHFAKTTHSQGQSSQRFVHDKLGYNYRMTNIQAALLYGQLQIIPDILEMKYIVFEKYRHALKDREDVLIQISEPNTQHANWMMGIRIPGHKNYQNAELYFKSNGIEIRPMFYPISAHSHLVDNYVVSWDSCDNAITLNEECFVLPSYPELTSEEQAHILQTLENYLKGQ